MSIDDGVEVRSRRVGGGCGILESLLHIAAWNQHDSAVSVKHLEPDFDPEIGCFVFGSGVQDGLKVVCARGLGQVFEGLVSVGVVEKHDDLRDDHSTTLREEVCLEV
jgi:hypothetical protein